MPCKKNIVLFVLMILSLLLVAACKTSIQPETSMREKNEGTPKTPVEQKYVNAKDRHFSFRYPQWNESREFSAKNAVLQVTKNGCAVFLEVANASYQTAFDSTVKFLKSGQGKSIRSSNVTKGIIEHLRWNQKKTQEFFSVTKFKECNEFTYVTTVTCDVNKIDATTKEVFETVINSVKCNPSNNASQAKIAASK